MEENNAQSQSQPQPVGQSPQPAAQTPQPAAQTPQPAAQTPPPAPAQAKKPSNISNVIILILLILIFVVLAVLFGYKKIKNASMPFHASQKSNQTTTTEKTEKTTIAETTATAGEETAGQTASQGGTTLSNKPNIDKDIEAFDKFNLSGIENDYSEDTIGDL